MMNSLIVGNKSNLRKILGEALNKRNHNIVETEPTSEALEILNKTNFSLIFLSNSNELMRNAVRWVEDTEES